MGNLGDALRKAGVVNEPQRPQKGSRRDRNPRGGGGGGGESRPAPRAGRNRDQVLPVTPVPQELAEDVAAKVQAILNGGQRQGFHGKRRWHYVLPDGRAPFVEVEDRLAQALEAGHAALAWDGDRICVLPGQAAVDLSRLDASRLVFWAGAAEG